VESSASRDAQQQYTEENGDEQGAQMEPLVVLIPPGTEISQDGSEPGDNNRQARRVSVN
jgi:hypothetical protein